MKTRRRSSAGTRGCEERSVSMAGGGRPDLGCRFGSRAFTLIEVMIAGGILFMCLFAILALVANGLRNARALQATKTDPRASIASQLYFELTHTNNISQQSGSGEFGDYTYDWDLTQLETNGLCELDISVGPSDMVPSSASKLQVVMYLPQMRQTLGGGPPPPR